MFTKYTDITAKDVKRLLLRVYKRLQKGELSPEQAQKETHILNAILKAIEVTDLELRLQEIENILKYDKD